MSKVLVLASYCGAEDDNGCTDINPCQSCMEMSNVFEADLSKAEYVAQLDDLRKGFGKYPRKIEGVAAIATHQTTGGDA